MSGQLILKVPLGLSTRERTTSTNLHEEICLKKTKIRAHTTKDQLNLRTLFQQCLKKNFIRYLPFIYVPSAGEIEKKVSYNLKNIKMLFLATTV